MRSPKTKDPTNALGRPVAASLLAAISIAAICLWIAMGPPVVYRPSQLIGPISLLALQPEIGKYFYWSAIGFCALAGLSAIALARLPPTKAARRAAWACGVTSAWVALDVLILPAIRIDAGLVKTGLASLYAVTYLLINTLAVVSWLRLFVVFPKERSSSEMANELGQLWNKIAISLPFGNESKTQRKGFFSWEFPFWRVALSNFTWVAISAVLLWFLYWHVGSLSYWQFFRAASAVIAIAALVLWLVGYPVLVFGVLGQYMLGGKEERKSLLWFLVGVLVPVLVFALMLVLIVFGILVNLGILPTTLGRELGLLFALLGFSIVLFPIMLGYGLVISLMIAVFYHGQIQPSAVIKKSTLYSVFGLIFTVLFVAIEGVIQSNLVVRLGEDSGQWSAILGGTFAALVFGPVRNRVERNINRIVDRFIPATALSEGEKVTKAVVFSDLAGYTKLSEENEQAALTLASVLRKEAIKAAESHSGRLIKIIGDAVLMEFGSAEDAGVAIVILDRKVARAAEVLDLPYLPLHSGVHWGEVTIDRDGDIYGATVNLAARLQSLASDHEVVASRAAVDQLPNYLRKRSLGEKEFKNISEPVECFLVEEDALQRG